MRRNNGSVDEMNAKYIPPYCNHNSFSRSYFCVIRSHLVFYSISFLPIHRLIKPKITMKVLCAVSLFPMFLPQFKTSPFSEIESYHVITRGVEWKFLVADYNHIYISTVYIKGLQPNSAKGNQYTGCPRRNVPDFGRVFLMLKYTDITQNTYVQSWTVTEIMAREKCGILAGPHTVSVSWQSYPFPSLSVVSYDGNSAHASHSQPCYVTAGHSHVYCLEP